MSLLQNEGTTAKSREEGQQQVLPLLSLGHTGTEAALRRSLQLEVFLNLCRTYCLRMRVQGTRKQYPVQGRIGFLLAQPAFRLFLRLWSQ